MKSNYRVSVDSTTVKVEMSTNEFFNLIKSVERAKTSFMKVCDKMNLHIKKINVDNY